jgi:O-antigen ligase
MAIKTILFALGFFGALILAPIWTPVVGVLAYMANYVVCPERSWYALPLRGLGIRYSFSLAIATAIGIALHWNRLRFGRQFLHKHERWVLVFLGLVWLSVMIGAPTVGRYSKAWVDHPSMKLTKIIIFAMMMTHVVTTKRRLEALLWVLIVCALILGLQAYDTPQRAFRSGRLNTIGGPDFREANNAAAFLACMLPLIGMQFMKSKWVGKGICLVSGAYVVNALVLLRSRGAVVGVVLGMAAAVFLAPRKFRLKILVGVIIASIGAYSLMDPQFINRSSTITTPEGERDPSAQSRIEIWKGSVKMLAANPLGVGAGNFYQSIGRYAPGRKGMDAHNTFVRCYSELGVQGFAAFLILCGSAALTCWRTIRGAGGLPAETRTSVTYTAYGMLVSLIILLGCGLTVTLLYMEGAWWVFALPVCMVRAAENLKVEEKSARKVAEPAGKPVFSTQAVPR